MRSVVIVPVGREHPMDFLKWFAQLTQATKEIEGLRIVFLVDQYTTKSIKQMLMRENVSAIGMISNGLASIYRSGLSFASQCGYDNVILMDVGHDPSLIFPMTQALKHVDMVVTSRFLIGGKHEGSWLRRIVSDVGSIIAHDLLGMKYSDCTGGYIALRTNQIPQLEGMMISKSYGFFLELKYLCRDLAWIQVPLKYTCNASGFRLKSLLDGLRVVAHYTKRRLTNAFSRDGRAQR
jgi:hypothetical protein